ncbi:hypothetical protein BDV26DRAFT_161173 [Aspergillus bertholletiae]|uniref:Uncharacterized protein n=1 Tax=Aspergillus bertholletiae TaxID=1226010 RepID=A0A5N7BN79_9EURO|nr:hypothetical protein BDV26DRAFT_161173 [Aspergillus bertholletiae]
MVSGNLWEYLFEPLSGFVSLLFLIFYFLTFFIFIFIFIFYFFPLSPGFIEFCLVFSFPIIRGGQVRWSATQTVVAATYLT